MNIQTKVFIPHSNRQLQHSTKVDIMGTHTYPSLKESTRENRGKGVQRKA